jgi:thioesterase domain-containing protein/acyl carrier protein
MYSHRNQAYLAWYGVRELHLCARDRLAGATYFPTVVASAWILRGLLSGATLCPYDVHAQGIASLAQWLAEMRITVFRSTPTFFRNLVATLNGNEDLSRLRVYSLGGEAILKQDVELYQRHFPDSCLLRTGLGLTEAGSVTRLFLHTRTQVTGPSLPAGYPEPGMDVSILDEDGREVDVGVAGEIVLRSHNLSLGYWRRPELTAERFATDPACPGLRTFRTGDLGRRLPDGCLVHLGRKDLMVKVRGMRVELPEVEAALVNVPGVRQAAVTMRPSTIGNQRLVACLVTDPGATPTVSRIVAHVAQRLPRHMVPSAFVFLPALPTTPAGKLDRRALPDPASERPPLDVDFWADRNPAENRLRVIWERVLGVQPIGVKDQFFELGGDSLAAARLMAEVAEEFHQDLPVTVLLEAPTIEALAGRLLGGGWEAPQAPVVALQTAGPLPPLFCVEALNAGQFIHLARRLGPQQPVYGLHPIMRRRPRTVESLARAYVAEVRRLQPQGPYQLCGLCAGGTVAFEMARLLRAQGQEVSFLGLFDAFVPRRRVLPFFLDRLVRRLRSRGERRARRREARGKPAVQPPAAPAPSAYARRMDACFRDLRRANRRALHRYRPGRYPGRLVLFLAESTTITPKQGERTAWTGLASGGADVHTVPGMHETMLHEPHVAVLAERLRPYLRA